MGKVKSPCINVCYYKDGVCQGCFRTLEEIANWNNYSEKEKKRVVNEAGDRKISNGGDYYGHP